MNYDFEENIDIDMTPLIDVVFMLLIFFIMTTTFSKPVLDIILPSSETAEVSEKKERELIITVNEKGKIFYNEREITAPDIGKILKEKPDELLNLHIDKNSPFEAFVSIVDIAKKERNGRFVISALKEKN